MTTRIPSPGSNDDPSGGSAASSTESLVSSAPDSLKKHDLLQLGRELHGGAADDFSFDRLYPMPIRSKSARYWTPVAVARRAGQLLASRHVRTVLDVGSGVGKFCLAASYACPDAAFVGIEQRPHLVAAARHAARRLGVTSVQFLMGDVTGTPWAAFDAVYLYNPFAENLYRDDDPMDRTVELSQRRLVADVRWVVSALAAARVGMCMVTYNGLGGPIPRSYDLLHAEPAGCDWLRVWEKRREKAEEGAYHLEVDAGVVSLGGSMDSLEVERAWSPRV